MNPIGEYIKANKSYVRFCLKLEDGTLIYKFVYEKCSNCNDDWEEIFYTDELGNQIETPNLLNSKPCGEEYVECRESQEWTYALDNALTSFDWQNAEFQLKLSDGSTINWVQTTASNGGWTDQLTEWANNLQSSANDAGLQWFVEPRTVNSFVPSDISVGHGPNSIPTGLPGASSVPVAIALINGGMFARYVNIQICPGQPVPVDARIVSHSNSPLLGPDYSNNALVGSTLTTAGAVLGPISKFKVCVTCDDANDHWRIFDSELGEYRDALESEIPDCWEPCGTLTLAESPPDRECTFEIDVACDNNNSQNTVDFTNTITRRATICNGEQIAVDYFQADPTDDSALVSYQLQGDFVDCATGLPVELPTPECTDFESLGNMYYYVAPEPATLVEWWADPSGSQAGTGVAHGNVSDIFSNDGSTLSHISGPADNSYISPVFSVEGTNAGDFLSGMGISDRADTSGTDQGKLSAFFNLRANALIRDGGTRTGERGGIWLDQCCQGSLELIQERTVDTTSSDQVVFNNLELPAGIHYAEAVISDLGAWWNLTLEASFDGGNNWEPLIGHQQKPEYLCIPVIKCKDTRLLLNAITNEVLNPDDLYCEDPCANLSSPNTHLIEGCIDDQVAAFTIVDDDGTALFPPKPLSSLGFTDCCDDQT